MKIQVIKRAQKPVTLRVEFNRTLNTHGQPIIMCRGANESGKRLFGYSKIDGMCNTSKAFAEWVEKALQHKLWYLAPRCGWVKVNHEVFSADGDLYGLVFDKTNNKVKFENRIGMQFIRKVLEEVGVRVEVHWDAVRERVAHVELEIL